MTIRVKSFADLAGVIPHMTGRAPEGLVFGVWLEPEEVRGVSASMPVLPVDDLPEVGVMGALLPVGVEPGAAELAVFGYWGGLDPAPMVRRVQEWAQAVGVFIRCAATVRDNVLTHVDGTYPPEPVSYEAAGACITSGSTPVPLGEGELLDLMDRDSRAAEVAQAVEELGDGWSVEEACRSVLELISGEGSVDDLSPRSLALTGLLVKGGCGGAVHQRDAVLDAVAPMDGRARLGPAEVGFWDEVAGHFEDTVWTSPGGPDPVVFVRAARRVMAVIGECPSALVPGVAALGAVLSNRGGSPVEGRLLVDRGLGVDPGHSLCRLLREVIRFGVRV